MSEAEQIISQYRTARHFAREAVGQEPVVCVCGRIAYLELENALRTVYDGILIHAPWQGWITFEGVKIYKSASQDDHFHFGHIEPSP